MTSAQEFIYTRTYSRWLPEQNRREKWPETVKRYLDFMAEEVDGITVKHVQTAQYAIENMDVMPSMRALWAAGPAARNNNMTLFNCSYLAVNDVRAFPECLFILMCGTGVGFSVERKYVDQLPSIMPRTGETRQIVVEDSKEGWAEALLQVLMYLWTGYDVTVDYSKIRPRGARLMTMGGRASGPEPLMNLFNFLIRKFEEKRSKKILKLDSLDCLDIMNMIADIVVVGGVRRSSEISLSDLSDRAIAEAKMGEFWNQSPWRSMSNNSAVYEGKPDPATFLQEWTTLVKSGSGERGIFNRHGAMKQMVSSGRREPWEDLGTNPCAEILLRDMQTCNLSVVVVRPNDSLDTLKRKVKLATMFGCWQASFTNYPFVRDQWRQNCEQERLLGVSLTGIMDHPVLNHVNDRMKKWLAEMKSVAVAECEKWCARLNMNMSAAITCVKPSGTVSQLVNCASGIHPRYAQYYIRRYRISATDPLFRLMRDSGVVAKPEVGQTSETAATMVLEFPFASPENAKTRHDYSAIDQLEHWKVVKDFWCEHNPSITVYVDESEWVKTAAWVHDHFDDVCGVSFLPKDNGVYQLAPYEEIDQKKYIELANNFPQINYGLLSEYEQEDNTQGSQSYACLGDKCEL